MLRCRIALKHWILSHGFRISELSLGATCHATTGPPKLVPRTIYGSYSWSPQLFAALQMVPPDQLWHRGWPPFATAGPPYNLAFITFIATLKMSCLLSAWSLKIAALHACQCT